jgi:hypothetical protein
MIIVTANGNMEMKVKYNSVPKFCDNDAERLYLKAKRLSIKISQLIEGDKFTI